MKNKIALLFCVEQGLLEAQAQLLINSIKMFYSDSSVDLIAVSPRKDFVPQSSTEDFFKKYGVKHIKQNLNTDYLDYPIANKVLACDYVESHYPQYQSILFIDTDTVFLNPIGKDLLESHQKLFLRPVDNKGPGTLGKDDEKDVFWQKVFELFEFELPEASLTTTVRQKTIRPYFNAGFIWAHGLPGFFSQWKDDFEKLVNSGLRPFGYKSRDNTDFRCLDQVALAVTSQRYRSQIEVLPQTYNYPIPFRPIMKDRPNHPSIDQLVHVHYHKWFQHKGFLDHVSDEMSKQSETYQWLKTQLPISPEIKGEFKC